MARRILADELDWAIVQHALWLRTTGQQGIRIDFSGCVLNGKNLRGLDLRGAVLRGTQLSWADLSGADLRAVDLCGAIMDHALLVGTDLTGANLSAANLHRSDITGAELADAILMSCEMTEAICRNEQPPEKKVEKSLTITASIAYLVRTNASRALYFATERLGRLVAAGTLDRRFVQQRLPAAQLLLAKPEAIKTA